MLSMSVGEYINEVYIKTKETNVTDLADRLNVSVSTVSRIINDKMAVSDDMLLRLSFVLGRSPESWGSINSTHNLEKAKKEFNFSELKPFLD